MISDNNIVLKNCIHIIAFSIIFIMVGNKVSYGTLGTLTGGKKTNF